MPLRHRQLPSAAAVISRIRDRAPKKQMIIAVQGCGHGNLDNIYQRLSELEKKDGKKADILLVCGDFQALRSNLELPTLACPPKYRHLGDFHSYYGGRKVAPLPTLFIGGNHEASGHLRELLFGGWVAPNMFYLGSSGIVRFGGLRIAGVSGLYNKRHYDTGYHELPPYDYTSLKSVYAMRSFDVDRLRLIKTPLDIMISHEWPHGIYNYGDLNRLLRIKPHFRSDINSEKGIGAPPLMDLLKEIKPNHWFAAHMHIDFGATVPHNDGRQTNFLALDKCLPRRGHLRLVEVDVPCKDGNPRLEYDPEWLSIVKATSKWLNCTDSSSKLPHPASIELQEALAVANEFIDALPRDKLIIPKTFMKPSTSAERCTTLLQTRTYCQLLDINPSLQITPVAKSVSSVATSSTGESDSTGGSTAKMPKIEKIINEDEIIFD